MMAFCSGAALRRRRGFVHRRRRAARDDAERHQFHRHGEAHAIEPLVQRVEVGEDRRERALFVHQLRADGDRDLESLLLVAEVERVVDRRVGRRHLLLGEPGPGLVFEPGEARPDACRVEPLGRADIGLHELVLEIGLEKTERRQDAGIGGDEHGIAAEQRGERVGMERPGAAEGENAEVARIEAALHGDDAERAEHHLVGDVDDALGRFFRREAERLADARHGLPRRLGVEAHVAAEQYRRQVAEDEVGIAHGRFRAAAAIGDRPRSRPGAARSDAQRTGERGYVGNRAAAGADAAHVERRHLGREHPHLGRARDRRLAVDDDGDVGRGAAHVEGEELAKAEAARGHHRAGDAAGRTRQHRVDRPFGGRRGAHQPAVRTHDMEVCLDAVLLQTVLDARQVAPHDRAHIVVHHRGDGAVIFAEFGEDVGGERHRDAGKAFGDDGAQGLLMGGVGIGMHQRDGQRLDARTSRDRRSAPWPWRRRAV